MRVSWMMMRRMRVGCIEEYKQMNCVQVGADEGELDDDEEDEGGVY